MTNKLGINWLKATVIETLVLAGAIVGLNMVFPMVPVIGAFFAVPAFDLMNLSLWLGLVAAVAIKNVLFPIVGDYAK